MVRNRYASNVHAEEDLNMKQLFLSFKKKNAIFYIFSTFDFHII